MTQPIKTALSLLPLVGYLIFLVFFAYSKPLYTWDTVPYTATILSADISDPQLLHTRTYEYLQHSLSPQQYASVTSGGYAADLENNADHVVGQLDMYRIKPAYVIALRTLAASQYPTTSLHLLYSQRSMSLSASSGCESPYFCSSHRSVCAPTTSCLQAWCSCGKAGALTRKAPRYAARLCCYSPAVSD